MTPEINGWVELRGRGRGRFPICARSARGLMSSDGPFLGGPRRRVHAQMRALCRRPPTPPAALAFGASIFSPAWVVKMRRRALVTLIVAGCAHVFTVGGVWAQAPSPSSSVPATIPSAVVPSMQVSLMSHIPASPVTAGSGRDGSPIASSADGAYLLFFSDATNLVSGQSGPRNPNLFLFERMTGAVTLVSHAAGSGNTTADGASISGAISADGAWVAFISTANNLVPGQNDTNATASSGDLQTPRDAFLFERATGAVTLVSRAAGTTTTTGDRFSDSVSISSNGALVAFRSAATNLVPGQDDTNESTDAFLFERVTGSTTLVSHAAGGSLTAAASADPYQPGVWEVSVSANGAFVAFQSAGTDLVAGQDESGQSVDPGGALDAFVWSRATGLASLISHVPGSTTKTANNGSGQKISMSDDGAFITFTSHGTNLVPGQTEGNRDVDTFLYERATGTVRLVSHVHGQLTTTGSGGTWGKISGNGAVVVLTSTATNLVAGQVDAGSDDAFMYDRMSGTMTLISHVPDSPVTTADGNAAAIVTAVSHDGGAVVFLSGQRNLVRGQLEPIGYEGDAFLFERASGTVTLISHAAANPVEAAGGAFWLPVISADGAVASFASTATNLVAGQVDTSGSLDVFMYAQRTGTGPATTTTTTTTAIPTTVPAVPGLSVIATQACPILGQFVATPLMQPLIAALRGAFGCA